ncbi:MAG TPA: HopJ type III effector protein [Marinagarivorans sp.]
MNISQFLAQLQSQPNSISFQQTMAVIEQHYDYCPTTFRNADLVNRAGSNEGSCKLFAFARLQGLTEAQTLACFGDYYRQDVLTNPAGTDHANIRNFMLTGWQGIDFDAPALVAK